MHTDRERGGEMVIRHALNSRFCILVCGAREREIKRERERESEMGKWS